MCRTGGRRCPGSNSHGRATAAARQRKSRAERAYRAALAAGDTERAETEKARRDNAAAEIAAHHAAHTTATQSTTEATMPTPPSPDENSTAHHRDVTSRPGHTGTGRPLTVTNHISGQAANVYQSDVITGGITVGPGGMRMGTASTTGNTGMPGWAQDLVYRTTHAAADDLHSETVHTGRSSQPGPDRAGDVTDDPTSDRRSDRAGWDITTHSANGRISGIQVGRVTGGIWVNGHRVD